LQGGLPTDRIYAEWWLNSDRVQKALRSEAPKIDVTESVSVPAEIYAWKADPAHREDALALQSRNALALETAFANGLAIIGYQRSERGDGLFQLGTWNESLSY
jgi:predicted GNAT superfamily acetyltransferase